jgi:hypothetical protein
VSKRLELQPDPSTILLPSEHPILDFGVYPKPFVLWLSKQLGINLLIYTELLLKLDTCWLSSSYSCSTINQGMVTLMFSLWQKNKKLRAENLKLRRSLA